MGKSSIYGNRWRLGEQIGRGGQGNVFLCDDTSGVEQGRLALKSPDKSRKHPRFKNEILAVKQLDHPHIIKIIDYSDLDKFGEPGNKPYLVMPYAEGGNLSVQSRYMSFANDLDKTIGTLKDLASGLATAHAKGIIHRDIKPANILFRSSGQAIISDFGICFIREEERLTKPNEVVGPRHFIAPELDGGRLLDVTNAADIYSLGKIAYYMISGGKILPREALHDDGNYQVFLQSERHQLMGILLGQMICAPQTRIQEMSKVIERLEVIEKWSQEKTPSGLDDEGLSLLLELQKSADDKANAEIEAKAQKDAAHKQRMAKQQSFGEWLLERFANVAITIQNSGRLKAQSDLASIPRGFGLQIGNIAYGSKGGAQLTLAQENGVRHVFQIHLCDDRDDQGNPISDDSPRLALIPFYTRYLASSPHTPIVIGYITRANLVGGLQGKVNIAARTSNGDIPLTMSRISGASRSFQENSSLAQQFLWEDWPEKRNTIDQFVSDAFKTFFQLVQTTDLSINE